MSREFALRMRPAGRTGHPDRRPQREKKRICHAKKARPFGILDAPISLSGKAIANPETFYLCPVRNPEMFSAISFIPEDIATALKSV